MNPIDIEVEIAALKERCKTLEIAVSILQRKIEAMEQNKIIEYNLALDRARQG